MAFKLMKCFHEAQLKLDEIDNAVHWIPMNCPFFILVSVRSEVVNVSVNDANEITKLK